MNSILEVTNAASRALLAGTFLVSGATKLVTWESFLSTLESIGLPGTQRAKQTVALALPIGELILAGVLLVGMWLPTAAWIALFTMLTFTALAAWAAHREVPSDCHCFGALSASRFTRGTVIRNLLLTLLTALFFITEVVQGVPVSTSPIWATALVLLAAAILAGAAAQASRMLTQLASREKTT